MTTVLKKAQSLIHTIFILLACLLIVSANALISHLADKLGLGTQSPDTSDTFAKFTADRERATFVQRHAETLQALQRLGVGTATVNLVRAMGYAIAVMMVLVILVAPFAGVIMFASFL